MVELAPNFACGGGAMAAATTAWSQASMPSAEKGSSPVSVQAMCAAARPALIIQKRMELHVAPAHYSELGPH